MFSECYPPLNYIKEMLWFTAQLLTTLLLHHNSHDKALTPFLELN